jgi:2-aminobenzoate-CoA ligase
VIVPSNDVNNETAMKQELQSFVKASIAPYKYPRLIEFMEALPRTPTGKIQRYKLIEMHKAAAAPVAPVQMAQAVSEKR